MVDGYAQGLQDWITGSLHWSFMTKRYFQDKGAEVKRTRFVKLLPKESARKISPVELLLREPSRRLNPQPQGGFVEVDLLTTPGLPSSAGSVTFDTSLSPTIATSEHNSKEIYESDLHTQSHRPKEENVIDLTPWWGSVERGVARLTDWLKPALCLRVED